MRFPNTKCCGDLRAKLLIDDGLVLARVARAPVGDLAAIEAILQHAVQSASGIDSASSDTASSTGSQLTSDACLLKVLAELRDASEFQVHSIDLLNLLGLTRIHDSLAVPKIVADREDASHPLPLRLEAATLSRILSPVTSRSNWAKERRTLRGQPTHRRRSVELLRHGDEADTLLVELIYDLGEVR